MGEGKAVEKVGEGRGSDHYIFVLQNIPILKTTTH